VQPLPLVLALLITFTLQNSTRVKVHCLGFAGSLPSPDGAADRCQKVGGVRVLVDVVVLLADGDDDDAMADITVLRHQGQVLEPVPL
jgi:hypothetical protein